MTRLCAIGRFADATKWLESNKPPNGWEGTTLEYAELEMPCWFGRVENKDFFFG